MASNFTRDKYAVVPVGRPSFPHVPLSSSGRDGSLPCFQGPGMCHPGSHVASETREGCPSGPVASLPMSSSQLGQEEWDEKEE